MPLCWGWWGDVLLVVLMCVFVWLRRIALRGVGVCCGVAAWGLGILCVVVLG